MTRLYHHYRTWECHAMYRGDERRDREHALQCYADFLRDTSRFQRALQRVVTEWPIACEQFLTNEAVNRIAWLGQASMCIETGIPRKYRAGFMLLTPEEQRSANRTAHNALQGWIRHHARENRAVLSDMVQMRLWE